MLQRFRSIPTWCVAREGGRTRRGQAGGEKNRMKCNGRVHAANQVDGKKDKKNTRAAANGSRLAIIQAPPFFTGLGRLSGRRIRY